MSNNKQLFEKENNGYKEVYPLSYIQNIIDAETKESLSDILIRYNHIYVPWQDNVTDTRLSVPKLMRRKGLWISYDKEGTLYTEYFKLSTLDAMIDSYWESDDNWETIPNLEFVRNEASKLPDGIVTPEKLSPALQELIKQNNNITNLPDDEDLEEKCGVIKFKDRDYNPYISSGKGYKILRKNWVGGYNVLTQDMINKENTIYEIRYDFDLREKEITIPNNCVLIYNGGIIKNGTLVCNNTILDERIIDYRYLKGTYESIDKLNKSYNNDNISGLGKIRLRKNINSGKNILTQDMINVPNTIYYIEYDYDLNEAEITIPEGCILNFIGGSFKNGILNGNNIKIVSELYKIFDINISFKKNIISYIYPEWFGAKGDGITDDTLPIQQSINNLHNKGVLKLRNKTYSINGIDLTLNSNIGIEGDNDNTTPWVNQTVLLCNKNTNVFIKIVDTDYPDNQVPTIFGKSISIKNVFINSNNKAMVGINMNYDIKLSDVYVRNCIQDGIVFEAQSYPLYLTRVSSSNNGRHGIYVKPRYTTCYYLLNVELSRNNGYGMYIEGGAGCTLLNVLAQSNKAGGFKIKQVDAYDGKYKTFLSKLTFISCYTEANGTLSEEDELYDGNYSLKIEGLTSDLLFTNKIDSLSFIGCKFDNTFIEGTSNLLRLNSSFGNAIDYSKNIPFYLDNIRFDSIKIGDYNNPNLDTYYYKSNLTEVIQPSCFNDKSIIGTIQKDSSFLHIVGMQLQVNSYIKYTDRKENNSFFIFKCNKIRLVNNNSCPLIIGTCNVKNTDNNEVKEYNLKIDIYTTDSIFISEKNTNRKIIVNDLPLNAELYFNFTTLGKLL